MNILLLDASPEIEVFKTICEKLGHTCFFIRSTNRLCEILRDNKFDVAFVATRIIGDAVEACQAMTEKGLKCFVLTGGGTTDAVRDMQRAGAQEKVFHKPLALEEMHDILRDMQSTTPTA